MLTRTLKTVGTAPVTASLVAVQGDTYLVEVAERGNDALVEVLGTGGSVIARADHPERRTGTRRSVVAAPGAELTVRVTGEEHANVTGTATVRIFDLAATEAGSECVTLMRTLAAADADYAAGEEISRGHAAAPSSRARDAFARAADEYAAAERTLTVHDRALRGQAELALAGLEYLDLQDWTKTAEWAGRAAATLAASDPYRRARAHALAASAWMEIALSAPAGQVVPGYGVSTRRLFAAARGEFRRLSGFHLARGERYDAGLALTNIGMSYVYEGRYDECIGAFDTAAAVFGSIHETPRQAQAWQDRAVCLWGLGRLADARNWFNRLLSVIAPEPYADNYLTAINNAALVDYELGRFDESLQLYDRALSFAQQVQLTRDEAYSLYGIGLDYYALGDRERARFFLERSLRERPAALDARGRVASLRALATLDADQGRVPEAIAADREALSLAHTPYGITRIRIRLAVHTAAAGQLDEALAQLDEVIATTGPRDPLLQAEALVQRAMLLRRVGRPRDALADLRTARPRLHLLGGVTEEFDADLEVARTERALGEPQAALQAVEQALALADAVRLQTANPELRSQLQTPLRAGYDLKIDLLRARYEAAATAGHGQEAQTLAAAAFAAADAARAHSFADVAAEQYPPAVRKALAPELHRREELYRALAGRRFMLDAFLDRSAADDPKIRRLMSDIADLERQADTVNTAIALRAAPGGTRGAGGARRSLPRLPPDTVLVCYWLGAESAYAWVIAPSGISWTRLGSPGQIEAQAAAFHRALTRFSDVSREARLESARPVYRSILLPIAAQLSTARQWIIIPDGALDYVPFAALLGSEQGADAFVASRHDVALTPAAWMLSPGDEAGAPPRGRLLLVADPVYQADDPRLRSLAKPAPVPPPAASALAGGAHPYQRLRFTAVEAEQIAALFAPQDVDELLGLEATRERLLALDLSKYRFIHVATHGVVDAQVPSLSALVLGSYDASGRPVDGAVRVADLALETLHADVAVFSACETALGKAVPSEGLVGISSTVLARGAHAVVASLWPVPDDESGAHLMTEFYRHLLHDSMSASAALGAAMRSVLAHQPGADPALWAAFQVSVVTLGPGPPGGTRAPAPQRARGP